jgi:hypothetical protein
MHSSRAAVKRPAELADQRQTRVAFGLATGLQEGVFSVILTRENGPRVELSHKERTSDKRASV